MSEISLVVNGRKVGGNVEDRTLLVHFLRENLGLTGTHVGCDTSHADAYRAVAESDRRPGRGAQ